MSDFKQADEQFLLVGGNPVPCAVAGRLLTAPQGRITLVCTRKTRQTGGTRPVADRLKTWLETKGASTDPAQGLFCHEPLEITESDSVENSRAIRGWLDRLYKERPFRSLGLNYTGGTKAMSVHAYRTLEEWARDRTVALVFSYLDARALAVVFDPPPGSPDNSLTVPVPTDFDLGLEDLIRLHDWEVKKRASRTPALLSVAHALAEINQKKHWRWNPTSYREENSLVNAWGQWKEKQNWWNGKNAKSNTELAPLPLEVPHSPCLSGVAEAIRQELALPADLSASPVLFRNAQFPTGMDGRSFCEFIDGKWLEHFTLEAVQFCQSARGLRDVGMNLEVKLQTPKVEFELDVIAMRGYQLFVFSCSTSTNKKELKLKLLEVYARARQIGGDEARVALVCPTGAPNALEEEARGDIGREGRVKVFGSGKLLNLADHIEAWIKEQSDPHTHD